MCLCQSTLVRNKFRIIYIVPQCLYLYLGNLVKVWKITLFKCRVVDVVDVVERIINCWVIFHNNFTIVDQIANYLREDENGQWSLPVVSSIMEIEIDSFAEEMLWKVWENCFWIEGIWISFIKWGEITLNSIRFFERVDFENLKIEFIF